MGAFHAVLLSPRFLPVREILDPVSEVAGPPAPASRSARLLALAGLPSGAALVVYFLSGLSLGLALLSTSVAIAALAVIVTRRLPAPARRDAGRRVVVGLIVGVAATAAYDASRFALVAVLDLEADPWEALPLFGQLLTGRDAGSVIARAAGFAFHCVNGLGFAVAYTILLGRRGLWYGVGWALLLEVATLTFYPGWLDIRAIEEFATVSMVGHVCYGLTLGFGAARLLDRARP